MSQFIERYEHPKTELGNQPITTQDEILSGIEKYEGTDPSELFNENTQSVMDFINIMKQRDMPGARVIWLNTQGPISTRGYFIGVLSAEKLALDFNVFICEDKRLRAIIHGVNSVYQPPHAENFTNIIPESIFRSGKYVETYIPAEKKLYPGGVVRTVSSSKYETEFINMDLSDRLLELTTKIN